MGNSLVDKIARGNERYGSKKENSESDYRGATIIQTGGISTGNPYNLKISVRLPDGTVKDGFKYYGEAVEWVNKKLGKYPGWEKE